MNLPNSDETYMSDSCLFVSVYLSVYLSSVFLVDVIFIDGFSGSG